MKIAARWILASAVVSLALLFSVTFGLPVAEGSADHVRWDISSQNFSTTPNTISPGGVAFATARNPNTLTIKLTGSGTFIGPASGGTSRGLSSGLPVAGRLAVSPAAGLGKRLVAVVRLEAAPMMSRSLRVGISPIFRQGASLT